MGLDSGLLFVLEDRRPDGHLMAHKSAGMLVSANCTAVQVYSDNASPGMHVFCSVCESAIVHQSTAQMPSYALRPVLATDRHCQGSKAHSQAHRLAVQGA